MRNARLKIGMVWAVILASAGMILTGCASDRNAPGTFSDLVLTKTATNYVPVTNYFSVTNLVLQTNFVTATNTVTGFVQVTQTNIVTVPQVAVTPTVTVTTNYVYAANATVTGAVATVGGFFGPYGTVASAALAGVLALFAGYKNKQTNTMTAVAGSTAVALDTARKVIAALPNSAAISASFNAWLTAHQNDADIATELAQVADEFLDPNNTSHVVAGIVSQVTAPLVVSTAPPTVTGKIG